MGFKSGKTIHRDKISGLFVQDDGAGNGEVSVDQLRARAEARQAALNEAHTKDWTDNPNGMNSPAYGNAVAELNRTRSDSKPSK